MRRIVYIHQQTEWPSFSWNRELLHPILTMVRHKQGKLTGRMEALGFPLRNEATLQTLTLDVLKSSEIEGEILNSDQVRSSIAKRLGLDVGGLVKADRHVDGIVEMMLDATQNYTALLSAERMFAWHNAMFPVNKNSLSKLTIGRWRNNSDDDPMQVISGAIGKEVVHFEAPSSSILNNEMNAFIDWFNHEHEMDSLLKAGIAHFWFVTIHPFDDGNGRIARAIADMQLARSDESPNRFYSVSAQIRKERAAYYDLLERTQKGSLDITGWLEWFLLCVNGALVATEDILHGVVQRAKFWEKHSLTFFNPRQKQMLDRLTDHFEGKLTTQKWAKMTKTSHDTALRDIQDLVDKNVLAKEEGGGRSSSYKIPD